MTEQEKMHKLAQANAEFFQKAQTRIALYLDTVTNNDISYLQNHALVPLAAKFEHDRNLMIDYIMKVDTEDCTQKYVQPHELLTKKQLHKKKEYLLSIFEVMEKRIKALLKMRDEFEKANRPQAGPVGGRRKAARK